MLRQQTGAPTQAIVSDDLYLEPVHPATLRSLFVGLNQEFPPGHRLPIPVLRAAVRRGAVLGVWLTDGVRRFGFTLYQRVVPQRCIYVMYLAIGHPYQSQGLGGVLLRRLNELGHGRIILDVEDPDQPSGTAEALVRHRRIAFYQRNGFHVVPGHVFWDVGSDPLLTMTNYETGRIDWSQFYRQLHNRAYGIPLAKWMISVRPDSRSW